MNPVPLLRFVRNFARATLLTSALLFGSAIYAANDPGGGIPGAKEKVTLVEDAAWVTLNNGAIEAVIEKVTGRVMSYKLHGTLMMDPENPIYYSMDGGKNYEQPSGCVYTLISSTDDMVEISCKSTWSPERQLKHVFDIDLHYILRRGDTGLYAYSILDHPASYPAAGVGEWRIVWKLPRNDKVFDFERGYVDDLRNGAMPSYADFHTAEPSPISEIVRFTTGLRAGKYHGKYTYAGNYFDIGTWGLASDIRREGVWFVLGGQDYLNDGPTKQDLTLSENYLLFHLIRNHYDGSTINLKEGEQWRKMYGPYLLYCNSTESPTAAGDVLWADAKAQVEAEKAAWPYTWLANEDHPAASGRSWVKGKLVIKDPLKPSVNSAGAWVGLAAPAKNRASNWQYQCRGYQYWTRADAEGNYTLPGVRPGTYALYAFNNGAVDEYTQSPITVVAGENLDQGIVTWTVPHAGASIAWEIGTPDRTAREFRHGNEYFKPFLWDNFAKEFSNPLVYTIGTSTPDTWNFVHSALPVKNESGVVGYNDWKWLVDFNLAEVPKQGNATLTIAFASAHGSRLWLYVNGGSEALTRIYPMVQGGNALTRQGIHAKYSSVNISIPVSRLQVGLNTFTFHFSGTEVTSHVMYDYLRLELPSF